MFRFSFLCPPSPKKVVTKEIKIQPVIPQTSRPRALEIKESVPANFYIMYEGSRIIKPRETRTQAFILQVEEFAQQKYILNLDIKNKSIVITMPKKLDFQEKVLEAIKKTLDAFVVYKHDPETNCLTISAAREGVKAYFMELLLEAEISEQLLRPFLLTDEQALEKFKQKIDELAELEAIYEPEIAGNSFYLDFDLECKHIEDCRTIAKIAKEIRIILSGKAYVKSDLCRIQIYNVESDLFLRNAGLVQKCKKENADSSKKKVPMKFKFPEPKPEPEQKPEPIVRWHW